MLLAVAVAAVFALTGCHFGRGEQEMSRHEIREEVRALDLDVGGADVRFLKDDTFAVETDNPYVSVDVKGDVLTIRERSHVADLESSVVLIRISQDLYFDWVELDLGAGRLEGLFLNCGSLDLELGAGEMRFDSIRVAGEAEISGGAGAMDVSVLQAKQLDLELGVGECVIHGLTTEEADIDAGVGKVEITIPGNPADYTIRTVTGVGGITIDGEQVGSGTRGSGPNRLELSGGVGSIEIRFETE